MSEREAISFDDPRLRAACRKAWGGEVAPAGLRERLARAVADVDGDDDAAPAPILRLHPAWPLASAAVVALVLGLVGWRIAHPGGGLGSGRILAQAVLPVSLGEALVATHDQCAAHPDGHTMRLGAGGYAALGRQLGDELGRPVFASALPGAWQFKGADLCPVGGQRAAHLIFVDGARTVSVFSLPPDPARGKGEFGGSCAGHPIVAFATEQAEYCVVGCVNLGRDPAELDRLREAVRSTVVRFVGAAPRTTVAFGALPSVVPK